MPNRDHKSSEQQWREMTPSHRRHTKPYKKPSTLPIGRVGKWLLLILVLVVLYGTLKPECRGYQQSTPAHCVD